MGVWLILESSVLFGGVLIALVQPSPYSGESALAGTLASRAFGLGLLLLPFAIGLLLTTCSKNIAAIIFPRRTPAQRAIDISITDSGLMQVGTALIGVWMFATSFRTLLADVLIQGAIAHKIELSSKWVAPIIGIVLGAILITAGRGAFGFFTKPLVDPTAKAGPDALS
jgi:hypothetical protein